MRQCTASQYELSTTKSQIVFPIFKRTINMFYNCKTNHMDTANKNVDI
jgi:hypothetical protein